MKPDTFDPRLERLNAAWTTLALVVYLGTEPWIAVILAYDFFDRGWCEGRYSPFGKLSRGLLGMFPGEAKPVPARPHRLGARFGCAICLWLSLFKLLPWTAMAPVALVLGLVMLLEVASGISLLAKAFETKA